MLVTCFANLRKDIPLMHASEPRAARLRRDVPMNRPSNTSAAGRPARRGVRPSASRRRGRACSRPWQPWQRRVVWRLPARPYSKQEAAAALEEVAHEPVARASAGDVRLWWPKKTL